MQKNQTPVRAGTIAMRSNEEAFFKSRHFEVFDDQTIITDEESEITPYEQSLLDHFAFLLAAKLKQSQSGENFDSILLNLCRAQSERMPKR